MEKSLKSTKEKLDKLEDDRKMRRANFLKNIAALRKLNSNREAAKVEDGTVEKSKETTNLEGTKTEDVDKKFQ